MARMGGEAEKRVVQVLQKAVQQPTVTGSGAAVFCALHQVLYDAFPLFFACADVQVVDEKALLCTLRGKKQDKPLLFLSHLDVYPVRRGEAWLHPPFEGVVADGYVYGRGTLDMKGHLMALLTAAESLLEVGWTPGRDLHFAFSADEEARGDTMRHMGALLQGMGVSPAFVLDEGGAVSRVESLCRESAAMIGVAEKGYMKITLTAPQDQDAGRILRAADKMMRLRFYPRVTRTTQDMLQAIKPALKQKWRFAAKHPTICQAPLVRALNASVHGRALTRTNLALTALQGDALQGQEASITFHASLLPDDSTQQLLERIERVIGEDGVLITVEKFDEPSRVSPASGPAWDALCTAIRVHFPGCACVPYLIPGGTDARRMENICLYIYRFSPFELPESEWARMHHADERISIRNLVKATGFFKQMLQA